MKWTRCNHRHALKDYDYFVQGARNSRWPWHTDHVSDMIMHLRHTYGREMLDTEQRDRWGYPVQERNPAWFLDKHRKRIWVRSDVLVIMKLKGVTQ
jgi:hypothetical protein